MSGVVVAEDGTRATVSLFDTHVFYSVEALSGLGVVLPSMRRLGRLTVIDSWVSK